MNLENKPDAAEFYSLNQRQRSGLYADRRLENVALPSFQEYCFAAENFQGVKKLQRYPCTIQKFRGKLGRL